MQDHVLGDVHAGNMQEQLAMFCIMMGGHNLASKTVSRYNLTCALDYARSLVADRDARLFALNRLEELGRVLRGDEPLSADPEILSNHLLHLHRFARASEQKVEHCPGEPAAPSSS